MAVRLRVVSVKGPIFDDDVDAGGRPFLVVEGVEGEMGILPRHAPLLTALRPGPLMIRNGDQEVGFFLSGGFIEILPERVTVLADEAEPLAEISQEQAAAHLEEARARLVAVTAGGADEASRARAQLDLEVAEARLGSATTARRGR